MISCLPGIVTSVGSRGRLADAENQLRGLPVPPEIIQRAIWLYLRFTLSFRDVEDLLAELGIVVSYETVRRRVNHSWARLAASGEPADATPWFPGLIRAAKSDRRARRTLSVFR